jgi:hypothetical protein
MNISKLVVIYMLFIPRCAKEVHEAMEMSMEKHVSNLELFQELQVEHIGSSNKNLWL